MQAREESLQISPFAASSAGLSGGGGRQGWGRRGWGVTPRAEPGGAPAAQEGEGGKKEGGRRGDRGLGISLPISAIIFNPQRQSHEMRHLPGAMAGPLPVSSRFRWVPPSVVQGDWRGTSKS